MNFSNKKVVGVVAPPASGKTSILRFLLDSDLKGVYINTDKKPLPFRNNVDKLVEVEPETPYAVLDLIEHAEEREDIDYVVIDTLNAAFDQFENEIVQNASDTREAWGDYGNYVYNLLSAVNSGKKHYIVLAHEGDASAPDDQGVVEKRIPVKGAHGKVGVEKFFTHILRTCVLDTRKIDKTRVSEPLFVVTPEEKDEMLKYAIQTAKTPNTRGTKVRAAMGMWGRDQLYIDANIMHVFNQMDSYYS